MDAQSLAPSLICLDLCNLERDVRALADAGCVLLHVDILDGYFSPSMPLGLDTVRQLRARTAMPFDCHVMAVENDFFIGQLLDIGVQRLCFHAETERHIARKLTTLRNAGVQAGVALAPATPLSVLDYALELCDFVLLMTINPGFASFGGESRYPFMERKTRELRAMTAARGLRTTIELDGRMGMADMRTFADAGADTFVLGTSSLRQGELGASFAAVLDHVRGLGGEN